MSGVWPAPLPALAYRAGPRGSRSKAGSDQSQRRSARGRHPSSAAISGFGPRLCDGCELRSQTKFTVPSALTVWIFLAANRGQTQGRAIKRSDQACAHVAAPFSRRKGKQNPCGYGGWSATARCCRYPGNRDRHQCVDLTARQKHDKRRREAAHRPSETSTPGTDRQSVTV